MQTNKEFYQEAMRYGTTLGAVWSVTYLLLFVGVTNTTATFLFSLFYMASPFIAANLAIKYRKKECDNTMSYMQAWVFVWYMYICATLLSTLVAYIYFAFIDGGTFFASLQNILEESKNLLADDELLTQQMEQTINLIGQTTTNTFVWNIMSTSLFNSTFIPLVIALFVKRKNKQ